MTKPMVNISCPSGDSYDGEITVDGNVLRGVARVELTIEPQSLTYARLDVWASLTDVQAVFDAFPIWEQIDSAPKDGTRILICNEPDDAQATWWIEGDDRWANWDYLIAPTHWCPMPRMLS